MDLLVLGYCNQMSSNINSKLYRICGKRCLRQITCRWPCKPLTCLLRSHYSPLAHTDNKYIAVKSMSNFFNQHNIQKFYGAGNMFAFIFSTSNSYRCHQEEENKAKYLLDRMLVRTEGQSKPSEKRKFSLSIPELTNIPPSNILSLCTTLSELGSSYYIETSITSKNINFKDNKIPRDNNIIFSLILDTSGNTNRK